MMKRRDLLKIIKQCGFVVRRTDRSVRLVRESDGVLIGPPFVVDDRLWALYQLAKWALRHESAQIEGKYLGGMPDVLSGIEWMPANHNLDSITL